MAIMDINIADPEITLKNMSHAARNNGEIFHFRHRKRAGRSAMSKCSVLP